MKVIYTAWWQGFDNAPDAIRICHQSLVNAIKELDIELVPITYKNLDDYTDLPGYIVDKYRSGIITSTNFSDILRFSLLSSNGGLWADASMYFYKPLNLNLFKKDFFTMKRCEVKNEEITSRWLVSFIGGNKHFPLFDLMNDFWLDYWKHEEELIAYLLVDNIMYLGYKKNKVIREAFDACDTFHYPVDYFQNRLNNVYDEKMENKLACGDDFFKLTYKKNFLMENNGKPTLWNALRRRVLNV
ncbi:capsular polysaccharide synthesis protein [Bifidobacterium adolescentis]|uniref:capsular polysaccharide synthesis protein n=1 Tax=Bifidobacterium adolescentis TaxID=1680 RepID=UPI0013C2C007|nr:capsular polysaccharide synthesis protein [Bifidobacterium adolescentis]